MDDPPIVEQYAAWALIDYESARAQARTLHVTPELFTDPSLREVARSDGSVARAREAVCYELKWGGIPSRHPSVVQVEVGRDFITPSS
jgi:hypothetical protein